MTRKSGLGKGLDALIPSSPEGSALPASGLDKVAVQQMIPNPQQPRTTFKQEELQELADSIREHGVIQPLVLTRGEKPDQYVIIAGERRWQAAKLAGLTAVPVVIRDASSQELLELALIENIQRADLSPLETAEAYQRLSKEYNLTHEQIAQRVGKSRTAVTNTLRLLDLSKAVKEALAQGVISEGHARALHGLSAAQQAAALAVIVENDLNVRQTEDLAGNYKGKRTAKKKKQPSAPPEITDLEQRLIDTLQTRVKLTYGPNGGSITLRFGDDEELNKLIDILLGEQ